MDRKYMNLLVEKFWNGTASESEKLYLYNFLRENYHYVETELQEEFSQYGSEEDVMNEDRNKNVLKVIKQKLNEKRNKHLPIFHLIKQKSVIGWVAAALLIFAFVSTFLLFKKEDIRTENISSAVLKIDTIMNNSSQVKFIALPDKSTVLLYPRSSIYFQHIFNKRSIQLTGKALFKVVHDAKSIFSVTTGEIITTDIGTKFEIDALNEKNTIIHLIEGEIKVGSVVGSSFPMKELTLNAGEALSINNNSGRFDLMKPSLLNSVDRAVHAKSLTFDKTPLEKVFRSMEYSYKIKIVFNSRAVAKLTFTGTIQPNDSLTNIINVICYMNNLHCSQRNNTYIITQ